MRIGYAKLGRAMPLPPIKWGEVGGDNEPPVLLNKLARRNPEHEFIIIGRNSGEVPQDIGLPPNVRNPWTEWRAEGSKIAKYDGAMAVCEGLHDLTRDEFLKLDGIIVWLGQHGTSNSPIPEVKNPSKLTQPQISFVNYSSYIIWGINAWQDDGDPLVDKPIFLCPDVRNYLKGRDLKWPLGSSVMSQYTWEREQRHYMWGERPNMDHLGYEGHWDGDLWVARHRYSYDRLEISGIPSSVECSLEWEGRRRFGILINEARGYTKWNRLNAMQDWVMQLNPDWIHGKWSDESQAALGVQIHPLEWTKIWDQFRTVRTTMTTPSSGSGWATTKPWECFAVGTVCFFHPRYDDQGNVIPTLEQAQGRDDEAATLAKWLRVETPEQLAKRVDTLDNDKDAWTWLVQAQRRHFDKAMEDAQCVTEIERRLNL